MKRVIPKHTGIVAARSPQRVESAWRWLSQAAWDGMDAEVDVSRHVIAAWPLRQKFVRCTISQLHNIPRQPSPSRSTRLLQLLPNTTAAIMSDYEDEMDVDPKPSTDAIQFGTDKSSGKTKRLTADLPVEAADNLPW